VVVFVVVVVVVAAVVVVVFCCSSIVVVVVVLLLLLVVVGTCDPGLHSEHIGGSSLGMVARLVSSTECDSKTTQLSGTVHSAVESFCCLCVFEM